MIIALLVVIGYGAYHLVSSSGSPGKPAAAVGPAATHHPSAAPSSAATPTAPAASDVVIQLTAVEDCWVYLTNGQGATIYSGVVPAGSTQTWKETQAVDLRLGNPAGIVLTVNGKKESPGTSQPVTLTLGPAQKVPSQPATGSAG